MWSQWARIRSRLLRQRRSRWISVGVVLALTGGLVGTVVATGVTTRSLDVADGDIWVWSSRPGQAGLVNSNSGRVDQNRPLRDSRGHRVTITQNDRYLLLHDLDTGTVTSVDLRRMAFTGAVRVPRGSDVEVVMFGDRAAIVDERAGEVRGLDPANLRPAGAVIHLPAPLAGGDFDASGRLWVGVPTQGTVVDVTLGARSATVAKTETVAAAGDPMVLSVLDSGALAADPKTGRISIATTKTVTTRTADRPLTDVLAPARTVGPLAALTIPGNPAAVLAVPVSGTGKIAAFTLPAGVSPGAATPFAGRLYVPDSATHQVLVYSAHGAVEGSLSLGGATGPLELEVREDHLMINAPDSNVAQVVDENGVTSEVQKYQPGSAGIGNGPVVIAAPAPDTAPTTTAGASASPSATAGGNAPTVTVTQTGRTTGSVTVKVTFSGTASACTVSVVGGDVDKQSHSCKNGGSYTLKWLWASANYTIAAKVTGADQQTATGSTIAYTTVINTMDTCSGSGCDNNVYAQPHTSSSVAGTWSYESSTTVFCEETGDSVTNNGNTSDIWLHIPYPHGFVPLVDTTMTQAKLDTVPTYCDAD